MGEVVWEESGEWGGMQKGRGACVEEESMRRVGGNDTNEKQDVAQMEWSQGEEEGTVLSKEKEVKRKDKKDKDKKQTKERKRRKDKI